MANAKAPTRILHVDGDSFFASCEIALHPEWQGRPVWVGGGRRGDGIVIAANRVAKKFGVTTFPTMVYFRNKEPSIYDGMRLIVIIIVTSHINSHYAQDMTHLSHFHFHFHASPTSCKI